MVSEKGWNDREHRERAVPIDGSLSPGARLKSNADDSSMCPAWMLMVIGAWPAVEACLACSETATARVWGTVLLVASFLAALW